MATQYRPWYTFRRFLLSQSPPSSMRLQTWIDEFIYIPQWKSFRPRILLPFCFLCVACDEIIIHVEKANPQQVEDDI